MFQEEKIVRVTFLFFFYKQRNFVFRERKSIRGRKRENKVGRIQIEYERILEESFTTVLFFVKIFNL